MEPDPKENFQLQANEAEDSKKFKLNKSSTQTTTNSRHPSYHYKTQQYPTKKNLITIIPKTTQQKICPVGWGCRICCLHLCWGLSPHSPETCWPWVTIRKVLRWNPGGQAVIDQATEWSMACNTLLWPLLALTDCWIGLIQSISSSHHALAHICLFSSKHVIQSAFVEQFPTLYLIHVRRPGLKANCA